MDSLQYPAARAAILEVVHAYFRCLDDHDAAGLAAVLAPELRASHTLTGEIAGRDAFLAVAVAEYPGLERFQHYCSNEQIEVDGDRARCRAYLYAQHVVAHDAGTRLLPGGGRYEFELVRTQRGWTITRLANQVTWMDPALAAVFRAS